MLYLVRNKEDKTVVYAFTEKPAIGRFLKRPVIAYDIRPDTHEIIETKDLPADFAHGAYEYDGEWKVKDQALIDAAKAEKERLLAPDAKQVALSALDGVKADLEGKTNSLANLLTRIEALEKLVKTLI